MLGGVCWALTVIQQKDKYGKRKSNVKLSTNAIIPASDFHINAKHKSCRCPAGNTMWLKSHRQDSYGNDKLFFEGRLTDCRQCAIKQLCMKNPAAADSRKGHGRQVSFIIKKHKRPKRYTDWMKARIDSDKGKQIDSHRMSVVEPVFANIASNKGLNRFSLRGKAKVQGQWQLYCLVHNIEKLKNDGNMVH